MGIPFTMDMVSQSRGLRSHIHGLSHGLKIARSLSIFTPVCGLVSPFRVPSGTKIWGRQKPTPYFCIRTNILLETPRGQNSVLGVHFRAFGGTLLQNRGALRLQFKCIREILMNANTLLNNLKTILIIFQAGINCDKSLVLFVFNCSPIVLPSFGEIYFRHSNQQNIAQETKIITTSF